jgi:hypothetical protein
MQRFVNSSIQARFADGRGTVNPSSQARFLVAREGVRADEA